ncbi:MAG: RNA-guided pseudouridylation complex pseudouridine synthase subunit Cbf5 [Candidatus Thorarchaeota archaeon]
MLPADRPRETLIKVANATTDPSYGFGSPKEIPVDHLLKNGVICLDKPAGPTSHEVSTWVRKILDVDKAGHSGTLDPGVTGVLPIGIGNATKVMQALLPAGKEYVGVMQLHRPVEEYRIREIVSEFTGKIYQRPPLKSSVKRVLRVREIYYNRILQIKGQKVLFRVGCQAGTYIRKLCFDIGEALGVGADMRELRRTRVGKFTEDKHLCTLYDLKDAYHFWKEDGDDTDLRRYILPVEFALRHLPEVIIRDSAVDAICHGADLAASGVVSLSSGIKAKDLVAIKTLKREAVALGRAVMTSDQIVSKNSGIVINNERVIMERGRYPPMWKRHEE